MSEPIYESLARELLKVTNVDSDKVSLIVVGDKRGLGHAVVCIHTPETVRWLREVLIHQKLLTPGKPILVEGSIADAPEQRGEKLVESDKVRKSRAAVNYLINRIRDDERLAFHFISTESLALLIEAAAALNGEPVEKVRAYVLGGQR